MGKGRGIRVNRSLSLTLDAAFLSSSFLLWKGKRGRERCSSLFCSSCLLSRIPFLALKIVNALYSFSSLSLLFLSLVHSLFLLPSPLWHYDPQQGMRVKEQMTYFCFQTTFLLHPPTRVHRTKKDIYKKAIEKKKKKKADLMGWGVQDVPLVKKRLA